jgi:hypothetical protein
MHHHTAQKIQWRLHALPFDKQINSRRLWLSCSSYFYLYKKVYRIKHILEALKTKIQKVIQEITDRELQHVTKFFKLM